MNTSLTIRPASDRPTGTPIRSRTCAERLRLVLRVNAATSIVSGLLLTAAPQWVDGLLGTGQTGWIRLIGIGVILFGIDVALVGRSSEQRLVRWTPVVIAADVAWVVASVVTVLMGWYSTAGVVAVLAMAAAVDTFALLQWRGWRQLTTS